MDIHSKNRVFFANPMATKFIIKALKVFFAHN